MTEDKPFMGNAVAGRINPASKNTWANRASHYYSFQWGSICRPGYARQLYLAGRTRLALLLY